MLSATIGNNMAVGDELQNYRLAIAATAEYTAFFGGQTGALAAIETFVSDVNTIFENELSIHFDLVSGTNTIFTDSGSDGYTNGDIQQMLAANTAVLDGVIGNANYDIGHVFGLASSGGSGLGGLGVVNDADNKGRGASIFDNPQGTDWVRLVAHEFGHQFGAEHTFNGNQYGSTAMQREADSAYEPASGSTLMSYAGIAGQDDLQADPDSYFHAASFESIQTFINASASPNSVTPTGNAIPTVSGGSNYTIPAGTPFELFALGSDANFGDTLTYTWEQLDLGPAMSLPITDNGHGPLFRSFAPALNPARVFPRLDDLVNNIDTAAIGEALPTTDRSLNFRATVRDGNGGVNSDDVLITVVDTGTPFAVTSPNTAVQWTGGTSQTIVWNVGGTDPGAIPANGIGVANVGIDLSLDGGFSYPITLASSTPNDGSHPITVPNINASQARIRVRGDGNVFFDLSDNDFTITPNSSSPGITVSETDGDTKVGEGTLAGASVDTYDLSINTTPSGAVQVTVNADLQTEVSLDGTHFSSSVTVDFSAIDTSPKTVHVRGFDDLTVEGIHTGIITHSITSSADAAYEIGAAINPVTVTIADDESPPLIGVDFGPGGTASPTNWTLVTDKFGSTTSDLNNELGIATTVDLAVTVSGGANLVNSNVIPNVPNHSPSLAELEGVRFAQTSLTLTWKDLIPGQEYDLWLFASENFSNTVAQDVTIVGEQTLPTFQMDTNPIGGNLLVNDSVADPGRTLAADAKRAVADTTGQIRIDLVTIPENDFTLLNGAAIQVVAAQPNVIDANLSVTTNGNEQGQVDIVFTVTLDQPNDTGVPITFDFDDLGTGSATMGSDYTAVPSDAQINVSNGASTGTYVLTVSDDFVAESDETVDVQISNPSEASITISAASTTATIFDNDISTISIGVSPSSVAEDGTEALTYTFTRDKTTTETPGLSVEFELSGTAVAGTDYAVSTIGTATFAPGAGTVTVAVNPIQDSSVEPDETVVLTLVDGDGYEVGVVADAMGLILNDDQSGNSPQVYSVIYFNGDAGAEVNYSPDGTGQRSIIRKIQITFSGPVTVSVGPVTDDRFVVESISGRSGGPRAALEVVSSELISGQQVVVLKFAGREFTEKASRKTPSLAPMLMDGEYRLTVDGARLGIDANGVDYGDNATDEFFRLFGDTDGDRDVDGTDHARFLDNYENGDRNFLFDFDSRPSRTATDEIEFTRRYGVRLI